MLIPSNGESTSVYVGTRYGLIEMDVESGAYQVYLHDPNNPKSLSNHRILQLYENRAGILWIGTNDGLNQANLSTKGDSLLTFTHYSEKDGLPSSLIVGIQEDDQG